MNELINNKKKSEVIAESLCNLKYGTFVSHEDIASLINEKHGTPKYNSEVTDAKKILKKKFGIIIKNVRGQGYKILNPDEYVTDSLGHYNRGFKELKKGYETLVVAPEEDMSEDSKDMYKKVKDRSMMLMASMEGVKVELKTLARKKHPFSPELIGRR